MAKQTINNGETGLVVRGKINDNFTETYAFFDTANTVSITGTSNVDSTGFGRVHICSGTSADYTVTLTVSASGNTGKILSFKGSPALTRFVTIDALSTETIDGATTKVIWSNEYFVMVSDGTNWVVLSESKRPLFCQMRITANQTGILGGIVENKININSADFDNSGRMADAINYRIYARRTGVYRVSPLAVINDTTAAIARVISAVKIDGTTVVWTGEIAAYAANVFPHTPGNGLVSLTAGSYAELILYHNGATQVAFGSSTSVSTSLRIEEVL